MVRLIENIFPRIVHNSALATGIGSEGAAILEYMKRKGLGNMDFLIPDENLSASDLTWYRLIFLVVGKMDMSVSETAVRLAKMAKDASVLTIGMAVMPSAFDRTSDEIPYSGETESLKRAVDLLMMISGDAFPEHEGRPSAVDVRENICFQNWLAAKTIMDVMSFNGIVGVDFDDVRSFSQGRGYGFFNSGQASGENRVGKALRMTMSAPSSLSNQDGNMLIYICCGPEEISMGEIGEILDFFQNRIHEKSDILWNYGYDPELMDDLRITVIRTRLDH